MENVILAEQSNVLRNDSKIDEILLFKRLDSISSHSSNVSEIESENRLFESNSELYQYFMNVALLRAKKHKNLKKQAGACIVNHVTNKIVGIGNYTEMNKSFLPKSILNWIKNNETSITDYVNHAEVHAISNRTEMNLENCIMFVTAFPCLECAKMILQSGLKHIVYIEDSLCQKQTQEEIENTKELFQLSGIQFSKLD